jgi:serpin B
MSALHVLALLALLPLVAFAGEPAPEAAPVVSGNTAFACDLYARLQADPGNLFLSPYSISACLGMTRAGAAGGTAAQMDEVFHFPSSGLGEGFRALDAALQAPLVRDGYGRDAKEIPAYEIAVANRLFGQQGYAFKPAFLAQMKTSYGAGLEQLDIRSDPDAARSRINGWVEEQTRDKIKDLLPAGTPAPDTRLVLVNAIYFKSSWQEAFRERNTQDGKFRKADGTDVDVRLMRRTGRFRYYGDDELQVLEMPYRNEAMSMLVVLPRQRDGLSAVEAKLSPAQLQAWLQGMQGAKVAVQFPKYEYTSSFDLTKTLADLGMENAFSPTEADFSGMTGEEPLFIGLVVHKAFVAVDEAGTEAAAATAVAMRAGSAPRPEEPVAFTADRPFLFLIRHHATGAILFLGRVVDPS